MNSGTLPPPSPFRLGGDWADSAGLGWDAFTGQFGCHALTVGVGGIVVVGW